MHQLAGFGYRSFSLSLSLSLSRSHLFAPTHAPPNLPRAFTSNSTVLVLASDINKLTHIVESFERIHNPPTLHRITVIAVIRSVDEFLRWLIDHLRASVFGGHFLCCPPPHHLVSCLFVCWFVGLFVGWFVCCLALLCVLHHASHNHCCITSRLMFVVISQC
jgi:hypothetical protein